MRAAVVAAVIAVVVASTGCVRMRDCYDATLVGTVSNKLIAVDKRTGKRREMHFWASDFVYVTLRRWAQGDELVVCNAMVSNTSKKESAPCGDLGCLWVWLWEW